MLTDVPVHVVTERAAKALSETVTPVGLVAVCSVPEKHLTDVWPKARGWWPLRWRSPSQAMRAR